MGLIIGEIVGLVEGDVVGDKLGANVGLEISGIVCTSTVCCLSILFVYPQATVGLIEFWDCVHKHCLLFEHTTCIPLVYS